MSRRKPPAVRWHVGDRCQVPIYVRSPHRGERTYWQAGEVVAVRGDRVVVRRHRWETEHACSDLRVPPRHVGQSLVRLLNRFGHDRHRRTV